MLLAIRAMEEPARPTVGKLAVEAGRGGEGDRRRARAQLSSAGNEKLGGFLSVPRAELSDSGPLLVY
jgi:hypothetical protein